MSLNQRKQDIYKQLISADFGLNIMIRVHEILRELGEAEWKQVFWTQIIA